MATIKTPFGRSMAAGFLRPTGLSAPQKVARPVARDERAAIVWPASVSSRAEAAGYVPLDSPPLLKLSDHLRSRGYVAVAFPREVRVFLPEAGRASHYVAHAVKDYSAALDLIGTWEASTVSYLI